MSPSKHKTIKSKKPMNDVAPNMKMSNTFKAIAILVSVQVVLWLVFAVLILSGWMKQVIII